MLPARPDRDAALRRDGLARARALRPPRGRLRRARPRRARPGAATPTPTATTTSRPTCCAVLDDRGIDRAVLAGASMGAHTLVRFALDHPERVAGLVIVTPGLRPRGRRERELERWDALADGLRERRRRGLRRGLRRRRRCPSSGKDTIDTVLRQRLVRPRAPRGGRRRAPAPSRARAPFESLGRARGASTSPTVVVASRDEADPEHPYAVGERYAEAIPGAELRSRGAGQLAAGLAGRPALEGDQRAGGASGRSRAMISSADSTTRSRS